MNKIKMGQFLKFLRKERKLSLEKLSVEFYKENLMVSPNAPRVKPTSLIV